MAKYEAWGTVLWVRNRPDHIEVHIGGCEVLSAEIGMKTPGKGPRVHTPPGPHHRGSKAIAQRDD